MTEDFLTLYCDPGEDFGWALGCGTKLLAAGTEKMWTMADNVAADLRDGSSDLRDEVYWRAGCNPSDYAHMPIQRIVCEDWRLYPHKLKDLAWDRCRTARVIGALTFMCRQNSLPFVLQPAAIKEAAKAAGAEELYYKPLRENRHQNDAIQHFVFFTNVELMGVSLPAANNVRDEATDSATED